MQGHFEGMPGAVDHQDLEQDKEDAQNIGTEDILDDAD